MENIKILSSFQFCKTTTLESYYKKKGTPSLPIQEKEVFLTLLIGIDSNKRLICRILCPINPLPICGWWNPPSVKIVMQELEGKGWTQCSGTVALPKNLKI